MKSIKFCAPTAALSFFLLFPASGQAASWTSGEGSGGDYEISDTSNITTPLTIKANAPSDAFFLDDTGNLGLGSAPRRDPTLDFSPRFYISDPTPDIELEDIDDPQIWQLFADGGDLRSDPSNGTDPIGGIGFFDQTAGKVPFFIESGAPSVSFYMNTNGYSGMGTFAPTARLHVTADSANEQDAQVLVQNFNTATPGVAKKLFVIKNNGPAKFSVWGSATDEWAFNGRANEFRISKQGSGTKEMELREGGDMIIGGTLTTGSSRSIKNNIREVEAATVLERVIALPISEWTYNHDNPDVRHLGPMSEDFYRAFGLGATNKGIAPIDTSGVALAAIKGLHEQLEEKGAKIRALESQLLDVKNEQGERILQLEMMLSEIVRKQSASVQLGAVDQ